MGDAIIGHAHATLFHMRNGCCAVQHNSLVRAPFGLRNSSQSLRQLSRSFHRQSFEFYFYLFFLPLKSNRCIHQQKPFAKFVCPFALCQLSAQRCNSLKSRIRVEKRVGFTLISFYSCHCTRKHIDGVHPSLHIAAARAVAAAAPRDDSTLVVPGCQSR